MPPVWTDLATAAALVLCPGGAAPTGYPGYYPQDAAHLALYLESSREAASFARYLENHVWGRAW